MKRLLCTLALAVLPVYYVLAAPASELNAGIVQGLWYSSNNVFADTPVRVYVAIRNTTGGDLTGTITFYDNKREIGAQTVAAVSGRIIESWVDWTPKYGDHTLVAKLSRVKISTATTSNQNSELAIAAAQDVLFVDYDTDIDDIGNERDNDDDGDGITDETEKTQGTDPLVYNQEKSVASNTEIAEIPSPSSNSTAEPAGGWERYLTPSRADSILSGITEWTEQTKMSLDYYRKERKNSQTDRITATTTVNADGFGTVTRSGGEEKSAGRTLNLLGLTSALVSLAKVILDNLFTLALGLLSWLLNYPMLIQLLLLLAILFAVVATARRLGGRPKRR